MSEHEPDELSPNYRTGEDTAEQPLEQDTDEADRIEEAASDARTADPRIAQPPS
jgi:hypothetical protein